MKFTSERDALVAAVTTASRASGRSPHTQVLELSVKGDTLTIFAAGGETTIATTVSISHGEDGTVYLPTALTAKVAKALRAGAVQFSTTDYDAALTVGRSTHNIQVLAEVPPAIHFGESDAKFIVSPDVLSAAISQTVISASSDDSRQILMGVYAHPHNGHLRLVATDSYRMSICEVDGVPLTKTALIPATALAEVVRMSKGYAEDITLSIGANSAKFSFANMTLITRLIAGDYPNYEQLVPPSHSTTFTTNRKDLLDAVKRMNVIVGDKTTPIRLEITEEGVELKIKAPNGMATDSLDGELDGDGLKVAFNPTYLLDGLNALTGDEVSIKLNDSSRPAILSSAEDTQFMYLLMPVRVV